MTAADDAYEAARELIAEAARTRANSLWFDTKETHALTQLPAEAFALTNLEALNLQSTQISDLSGVEAFAQLDALCLNRTRITDLTPIANLAGLTTLYFDNTCIADLSPIATLTSLSSLEFSNTPVTDLAPIGDLTELTFLFLDNTEITDLTSIANLTSLWDLGLGNTRITDLTPTASLTGLRSLALGNTRITNLTPLATLSKLTELSLSGSSAFDLRPLRALSGLREEPFSVGLSFSNTAATRADPRIAEIAEIEDNATRARTLFEYLETWQLPEEAPTASKPETLFETILTDGQLEMAADPPSQNERDEALKQALHQRLQLSVPDLARAAGNIFPRLASKARVLERLVSQAFADLDLLSIHLEVEILQDRLTRGNEDGVAFPEDVLGPLSDVTRVGPGLTLGHPSVDLFLSNVSARPVKTPRPPKTKPSTAPFPNRCNRMQRRTARTPARWKTAFSRWKTARNVRLGGGPSTSGFYGQLRPPVRQLVVSASTSPPVWCNRISAFRYQGSSHQTPPCFGTWP